MLARHPGVEVVATARDGLEALEKIADHQPDVVTLDLVMPNLDGIGVLRASPPKPPRAGRRQHVRLRQRAWCRGAGARRRRRRSEADRPGDRTALRDVGRTRRKSGSRGAGRSPIVGITSDHPPGAESCERERRSTSIGASTGGPPALTRLIAALPTDLPVPMAIVVHLPVEYTEAFAARLHNSTPLKVGEASDGMSLTRRGLVVARGGVHLKIVRKAKVWSYGSMSSHSGLFTRPGRRAVPERIRSRS